MHEHLNTSEGGFTCTWLHTTAKDRRPLRLPGHYPRNANSAGTAMHVAKASPQLHGLPAACAAMVTAQQAASVSGWSSFHTLVVCTQSTYLQR